MSSSSGVSSPEPYLPFATGEIQAFVTPFLGGIVVTFTLFGIGLLLFWSCIAKQFRSDRFTSWFLLVLLLSDLADALAKAAYLGSYVTQILADGLLGLLKLPRASAATPILGGWIVLLTHVAYGYRVLLLTRNERGATIWLTWAALGLAMALSVVQMVCAFFVATYVFRPVSTLTVGRERPFALTWMSGAFAADVLLTAAFCLHMQKHRNPFCPTQPLIANWVALSLETGAVPAAAQLAAVILLAGFPDRPYVDAFQLFLAPLYIIGVLIMIRTTLANGSDDAPPAESSLEPPAADRRRSQVERVRRESRASEPQPPASKPRESKRHSKHVRARPSIDPLPMSQSSKAAASLAPTTELANVEILSPIAERGDQPYQSYPETAPMVQGTSRDMYPPSSKKASAFYGSAYLPEDVGRRGGADRTRDGGVGAKPEQQKRKSRHEHAVV